MSDNNPEEENLIDEFNKLGQNLFGLFQTAWEKPERKEVQQELEKGMNEFTSALKREADYFAESPTGQRLKSDLDQLGERFRSGETQEKIRQEVIKILHTANTELEQVIQKWSSQSTSDSSQDEAKVDPGGRESDNQSSD